MRYQNVLSFMLSCCLVLLSLSTLVSGAEKRQDIRVDKDMELMLELLSPLNTESNRKGDKFSCKVVRPPQLYGSIVSGHISKSKHSGKANGKSELVLDFDTITLTDGRFAQFSAAVKEVYDAVNAGNNGQADIEGTVKGKSRVKVSVKRAVAGAAIGAVIGGILAGPKGAIAGAAIGSSAGVASVLVTDGPNLEFKQGTQLLVVVNNSPRFGRSSPEGGNKRYLTMSHPGVLHTLPE
jgi:hypothetical protein